MRYFIFLNYLLIVFFIFGCEPREKHELILDLEVGKTYTIEQETSQNFKQEFMGMDIDMKHRFNVVYDLLVKEYENDRYTLEFKYDSIAMDVEGSGINMSVSSGNMVNADDTLSMIFKAFTGKSFTVGVTNTGEIAFMEGVEEFFDLVVGELNFVEAEDEREAINAFDQFIGEGGFKDNISQLTNYLPGKPVSVGQKWENDHIQSNMGFTGKWANEWQLKEIDEEIANVIGVSSFSILQIEDMDESAELMPFAEFGMDMEMEGEQKMDHKIDRATGLIIDGVVEAKMEGYFKIGEGEKGMNIPVNFQITSKIRWIK